MIIKTLVQPSTTDMTKTDIMKKKYTANQYVSPSCAVVFLATETICTSYTGEDGSFEDNWWTDINPEENMSL